MKGVLGNSAESFIKKSKSTSITKWTGLTLALKSDEVYKGLNYLIQGGLADLVRLATIYVCEYITGSHLWGKYELYINIHDELVFWADKKKLSEDEFHKHTWDIKKIMESVYPSLNGVKMRVDVNVSNTSCPSLDKASFKKWAGG